MVDSPYNKCPTEYYLNCGRSLKDCYRCAAGKGQPFNQLFYVALHISNLDLLNHPYKEVQKDLDRQKTIQKNLEKQAKLKAKPSPSKLGYKNEKDLVKKVNKQVNNKISIIKSTVASGRVNHDGDHTLLNGLIKSDSKLRITTQTFSVSKAEYQKGLEQNINQWVITNQVGTCYVLTEALYTELIAQIIYLEEKLNEKDR